MNKKSAAQESCIIEFETEKKAEILANKSSVKAYLVFDKWASFKTKCSIESSGAEIISNDALSSLFLH